MTLDQVIKICMESEHKGIQGVPSCSNLDRIASCPGSFLASKGLSRKEGDGTYDGDKALRGSIMHYCIQNNIIPTDMPEVDQRACEWGIQAVKDLILDDYKLIEVERYLVAYEDGNEDGKPVLTGSMDFLFQKGNTRLILDIKTATSYEYSVDTLQLDGYILLCEQTEDMGRVWQYEKGILQPNLERLVVVDADPQESIYKVSEALLATAVHFEARCPGDDCTFCPAFMQPSCPETCQIIENSQDMEISIDRLPELLTMLPALKKAIKKVETMAKENIDQVEGWRLRSTGSTRSFKDTQAAMRAIIKLYDIKPSEFFECCSVSESKMVKMISKLSGDSAEDVRLSLENCLQGIYQTKEKAKCLAKEKSHE